MDRHIIANITSSSHIKSTNHKTHCMLPISVGQAYHEGEKLIATIELINKLFDHCTIMLCDSLQRHNLEIMHNYSHDKAKKEAILNGNKWLERNMATINNLKIPFKISRWDEWIYSDTYQQKQQQTHALFSTKTEFKRLVTDSAKAFAIRLQSRNQHLSINAIMEQCLTYAIEECTVLLLWTDMNIHYGLYPAKLNPAMQYIDDNYIKLISPELQVWKVIRFKKKSKRVLAINS